MWSKDAPTEPGYYWFKISHTGFGPFILDLERVAGAKTELFITNQDDDCFLKDWVKEFPRGEWQPVKPWEDA